MYALCLIGAMSKKALTISSSYTVHDFFYIIDNFTENTVFHDIIDFSIMFIIL